MSQTINHIIGIELSGRGITDNDNSTCLPGLTFVNLFITIPKY